MNPSDFHHLLTKRKTFFCYSGPLREGVLTAISESLRTGIKEQDIENKIQRKIFGIFIEQAQNIIRYSVERPTDDTGVGTVALSHKDDGILIESINAVSDESANYLDEQLKLLKSKTAVELKQMYKERLREGPPEDSKGAGLGLIDMARNSNTFHHYFESENEKTLFVFSCEIAF